MIIKSHRIVSAIARLGWGCVMRSLSAHSVDIGRRSMDGQSYKVNG